MTVCNTGTISTDRPIPVKLAEQIAALFGPDDTIHIGEREISFDDTPGDLQLVLNDTAALLRSEDIHIAIGDAVKYYGDNDGYIMWTGRCFDDMTPEEYGAASLTAEEMARRLQAHGYTVTSRQ